MKNRGLNRTIIVLLSILLASFFLIGCSEMEDDTEAELVVNSQPSIGAIPGQTVDVGGTVEVKATITDADVGDTHTVKASSDNTDIATVSVSGTTLTILGVAGGTATLTISATDDSGQDNAAATEVKFEVTVNAVTETTLTGITQNTTVYLTFDDDPGDVRVNDGIVEGSGNERTISQFSYEPLELTISWSNKDATNIGRYTRTIITVHPTITVGGNVITPPSPEPPAQQQPEPVGEQLPLPPPLPEPPLNNNLGVCAVGMILKAGQSCTYPGTDTTLSVREDGTANFLLFTVGGDIVIENANINGKRYTLVAVKRDDGSREIIKVGE